MLDIEIVGHINDTLAIASLSNRATLARIESRLNCVSPRGFALAAVAVLREQARRLAELEGDVNELTADNGRLEDAVTELEAELKVLRTREKPEQGKENDHAHTETQS